MKGQNKTLVLCPCPGVDLSRLVRPGACASEEPRLWLLGTHLFPLDCGCLSLGSCPGVLCSPCQHWLSSLLTLASRSPQTVHMMLCFLMNFLGVSDQFVSDLQVSATDFSSLFLVFCWMGTSGTQCEARVWDKWHWARPPFVPNQREQGHRTNIPFVFPSWHRKRPELVWLWTLQELFFFLF